MATESTDPNLLTYSEVAARLGISKRSVEALVARRAIPILRLSARCVRFKWNEVERALAKLTVREV
jgi:excisionase family DNA binding protein